MQSSYRFYLPSPSIGRGAGGEGHIGSLPKSDLEFDYAYLLT